jgi:hypothetical protein
MNALAEAFKKANLSEEHLVKDELENGLTRSIIAKIKIGEHPTKRAIERVAHIKNNEQADKFIRESLIDSIFMGYVTDVEGGGSYMYSHNGYAFHVDTDFNYVKTVYECKGSYIQSSLTIFDEIKKSMYKMYMSQVSKLRKQREKTSRIIKTKELDYNVEIAELERKIFRSRSDIMKQKYEQRIKELHKDLEQERNNLENIEINFRALTRAFTAVNIQ